MKKNYYSGMTLVEISLVLVVVGFLIVAVIKGADIMVNAQGLQVYNTAESINVAVKQYVERYHALPGDDPKASQRNPSLHNGNGNGQIDTTQEADDFWTALGIKNTNTNGYTLTAEWNRYSSNTNAVCFNSLSSLMTSWVDLKYDDGTDNGGKLISNEVFLPPFLYEGGALFSAVGLVGAIFSPNPDPPKVVCRLLTW
jgi:type II secretory pathway pseudopilin PulG